MGIIGRQYQPQPVDMDANDAICLRIPIAGPLEDFNSQDLLLDRIALPSVWVPPAA